MNIHSLTLVGGAIAVLLVAPSGCARKAPTVQVPTAERQPVPALVAQTPKAPDPPPPESDEDQADRRQQAEAAKRYEKFLRDIKSAQDPVALAVEASQDTHRYLLLAAIQVLVQHANDPRAEPALDALVRRYPDEPHATNRLPSQAARALGQVRAKRELAELLKDAKTPQQRAARIRALFRENPAWPYSDQGSKHYLVVELIDGLVETEGPAAVDLAVATGFIWHFGQKYPDALLNYAKQLGCEKTLAKRGLLDGLLSSGARGRGALLDEWIKQAQEESAIDELMIHLGRAADGQQRLRAWLKDSRPAVVCAAAAGLASYFPSETSIAAVEEAARRRKAAGATEQELDHYAARILRMKQSVSKKELKGESKP